MLLVEKLGLHETLELHEILNFKSLCLSKASTMNGLVQDTELKNILLQDMSNGREHIQKLQEILVNQGEGRQ
ncbi:MULTISPECIES: hypothetical protein [Peribacillus]|uniref:hypothetical protein n=1 Tax=Peribacillus TaxID=2675229 RepID=UPI001F4E1E41|nr:MULTISPECIES: hypothetical protein [unclassified Peribacillus]MCK1983642.1 hypothetical protein [Peribacillus sp. Aquil_B1]MCK2010869.1 hypothetical protein [Peribacillus sp. Aquil_B8]